MQVLIELDAETLRRLEKVAPGRSRKRSAFIRAAIQRSLWELDEEKTRQAYLANPDREPAPFDASAWEALPFGGFDAPRAAPKASAKTKPRAKAAPARRARAK
jgi:hypothetical protein